MNTKAAAVRWLESHIGHEIDTIQVRPSGITWEPGTRVLSRKNKSTFTLDGSSVSVGRDDVVLEVTPERLVLEWLDHDGVRIHVTTYTFTNDDDPRGWQG